MKSAEGPRVLWDVAMSTRDGIRLSSDVHLPPGGIAGGPYPAVLLRTPYGRQGTAPVDSAQYLSRAGYACVLQDVRGRGDSDGDFEPMRNEFEDGYDAVEWVAAQPWCNGRVGTMGGSYAGWQQWALAREHPPHLVTMVSTASAGKWQQELPHDNGILRLVMLGWLNLTGGRTFQRADLVESWPDVFRTLPVANMPEALGRALPTWQTWIEHPGLDDYWGELRLDDDFAKIDLPVLHITGWWDGDQAGAMYFYDGMQSDSPAQARQSLVVGPWDHSGTRMPRRVLGDVDFGETALLDINALHQAWFDTHLRGDSAAECFDARYFVTGWDRWASSPAFPPPPSSQLALMLSSSGRANSLTGDGELLPARRDESAAFDEYRYDPADPVIGILDENFYSPNVRETPLDHGFKQSRDDVLVYTSEPVDTEQLVIGRPRVTLHASSDGPDTDWFVAISDVDADGRAMLLTEGRLRARFRQGLGREELLEPGEIYEFVIDGGSIAHALRPGHRLRLTVTSSDFPIWERNLNTGRDVARDTEPRVATNRIFHSARHASSLVLPLVEPGSLAVAQHLAFTGSGVDAPSVIP